MEFPEFESSDLSAIRRELTALVEECGLPLGSIDISQDHSTLLTATATVLHDPLLADAGNAANRNIHFRVTMFTQCDRDDREVIWARILYEVSADHSNFFPIPAEYGKNVLVEISWEFDRETLMPGCAAIRDLDRLHFVSVLPNDQLSAFVECCSQVGERWAE